MTTTATPAGTAAATAADPESALAGYRARVRTALEPFLGQTDTWEREGHLPRELFAALGEAGAFRERWEAGAVGGLPFTRALTDEIAPYNGGAALALSIHSEVFAQALLRFGGPAHADTLRDALDGRAVGCVALTEPGGGSDLYSMATAAVREEDGGWRLTGLKRYTTNVGRATHVLALARTGAGPNAFSLFLVPLDRPGVRVTQFFDTMGMRSADTGGVAFDLRLDASALVGRPHAGLMYTLKLLDYERIAASMGLVSAARAALRLAAAHLRERTQFGKRLFDHQALSQRLADRWAETQAADALIDAACRGARGDQLPHDLVAAAKLVAARSSCATIDEALQLLGGRGYTEDYPLERMYRDCRLARIGGGTDEMLRQIIATCLDVPDPEAGAQLDRYAARARAAES
jgi:alkylation response protein AidB-like acyl-CoA dehydrogenase